MPGHRAFHYENASPPFFWSKIPRQVMWQAKYQVQSFLWERVFRIPPSIPHLIAKNRPSMIRNTSLEHLFHLSSLIMQKEAVSCFFHCIISWLYVGFYIKKLIPTHFFSPSKNLVGGGFKFAKKNSSESWEERINKVRHFGLIIRGIQSRNLSQYDKWGIMDYIFLSEVQRMDDEVMWGVMDWTVG